jgi:hypothetical protein
MTIFWAFPAVSMNYPDNGDEKIGSCGIVGFHDYGVGIAAARGFQVFHPDDTAVGVAVALLDQLAANGIVPPGLDSLDGKGIVLVRPDLNLKRQRRAGLALQAYRGGTDFGEFQHLPGNDEIEYGVIRIVGLDPDRFFFFPAAVIAGVEFDCDASFLPGKDLPRTCRGCAASAGFDFENIQRFIALVKDDEFVDNFQSLQNRRKLVDTVGKIRLRPGWRVGIRGMAGIWQ